MSSNKPFPSSDLDVFKENSLILDNFVNSQENEHPDRFARKRPTITGIIKEAFNVRTDISNMNETLIGQSRWDVVPKNTSLSLGGDNGALNKQAQALFNRTVMLKAHAREALRRTYLEAGYNLVEGSFEQGGVLQSAKDVILEEKTGKVYSWAGTLPKTISNVANLEELGFNLVNNVTAYEKLGYAVVDRFFIYGEASWAPAISRAINSSRKVKFLPGKTYNCEGAIFHHASYLDTAEYDFSGAIIEGTVRFQGAYNTKFIGGVFTGTAYFQNIRFSKFETITFNCPCYFGYYNFGDSVPTYSLYWNNFDTVIFNQGFELNSSIERASFNSNTFINAVFRAGTMNATMVFKVDPTTGPSLGATFGSNTFIGCDWSYAPALDIKEPYKSFSMSIIGGYLDTGSVWLAPESWEPEELSVTGLSNPGSQAITRKIGVNPVITTSGARKRAHIPVGSVNYVITEQLVSKINGTKTFSFYTAPLPYTGLYTVSTILETIGEGLFGSSITNTTQGTGAISGVVDGDGLNSFVFSASKGDVILIKLASGSTTDVNLLQLAVTPGVGVVGPVPYRTAFPDDIYTVNINTSPTSLASFSALQNKASYFDIEVTTRGLNVGYGGEKIKLSAAISAGATNINAYDLKEISRHTFGVNGGSITLSVTVSGLVVTLMATSSINGIPARVKVSSPNYAP